MPRWSWASAVPVFKAWLVAYGSYFACTSVLLPPHTWVDALRAGLIAANAALVLALYARCLMADNRVPSTYRGAGSRCVSCRAERPFRAHHCVECGVCILERSHHCLFLNANCVGRHNQAPFISMIALDLVLCVQALAAVTPTVLSTPSASSGEALSEQRIRLLSFFALLVVLVLALIPYAALLVLANVVRAQTLTEYFRGEVWVHNDDITRNWTRLFGAGPPLLRALWPCVRRDDQDGYALVSTTEDSSAAVDDDEEDGRSSV